MYALEELQQMPYKQLQKLAKSTGACKANAKSAQMIESLANHFQAPAVEETPASVVEETPAATSVVEDPVVEEDLVLEEVPLAEAAAAETVVHNEATLQALSRSELQTLAKETGACKANVSSVKMIAALVQFFQASANHTEVLAVAEAAEAPTVFDFAAKAETASPAATDTVLAGPASPAVEAPAPAAEATEERPAESVVDAPAEPAVVDMGMETPVETVTVPAMDDFGLDALINKFSDVLEITSTELDSGKVVTRVKCELTEHEMPLDFDAVCDHVGGQTFTRRYKQWQQDWEDQAQGNAQCWGADENENFATGENIAAAHTEAALTGKLRGVATPQGKKTIFKSPKKTPNRIYEQYNATWSIDDFSPTNAN